MSVKVIDPLTIAFIGAGVGAAHEAMLNEEIEMADIDFGQIELMGEAIAFADQLDRRFNMYRANGVFAYEIAEPFGYRYASARLRGEDPKAQAIIDELFTDYERS